MSPLWTPAAPDATQMAAFITAQGFATYGDLYRWSITDPGAFWSALWQDFGVIGERSGLALVGDDIFTARFFPEARLNYSENCLASEGDGPAVIFRPETGEDQTLTWNDLRALVSRMQQAMTAIGITAGDRVAGLVANTPETLAAMLATASLGAVWSSCSPDFGVASVIDRFAQITPKLLFASKSYTYKGKEHDVATKAAEVAARIPSLARLVLLGGPEPSDWLLDVTATELRFVRQGFNAPLFIMFSSGTSGVPKCIVHSIGGTLLQHMKEHRLHCDIRPGDRLFFFSTASWMMWNWMATGLASRATLVLYDGSPFHPGPDRLWQMAADLGITHFGTSPRYLESLRAEGFNATQDLSVLRMILSTGAPLSAETARFTHAAISSQAQLTSISGGTDIISCFLLGNPMTPVHAGELQGPGLGMDIRILDPESGAEFDGPGELVCATPFPSRPTAFWGDDGSRYRAAYFERFPGVWCQHDQIIRHPTGYEILGRSDATLNPGGVRIGAGEITRAIAGPEIAAAAVVGRDVGADVELVLCVTLRDPSAASPDLAQDLRQRIRAACTPRHVPEHVLFVPDLPRTRNGKLSESAVRAAINRRLVSNTDQLENPECLMTLQEMI